jgi:sec-independent protein translocase protein TatA
LSSAGQIANLQVGDDRDGFACFDLDRGRGVRDPSLPRAAEEGILMFGLGPMELGIILVIVTILFGAKKLPEVGRGLGDGIRLFKDSVKDSDRIADGDAPRDPS